MEGVWPNLSGEQGWVLWCCCIPDLTVGSPWHLHHTSRISSGAPCFLLPTLLQIVKARDFNMMADPSGAPEGLYRWDVHLGGFSGQLGEVGGGGWWQEVGGVHGCA